MRIVIEADRPLDENFQDIYLIDSKGIRHNIILYFLNNRFEGEVDTLPFSCGIASLFVRVKDDVGTFLEQHLYLLRLCPLTRLAELSQRN